MRSTPTALAATVVSAVAATVLSPMSAASAATAPAEAAASANIDTFFTFRKVKVRACIDYREEGVGRLKTRADARKLRGNTLATYYVDVDFGSNDSYGDHLATTRTSRAARTSSAQGRCH